MDRNHLYASSGVDFAVALRKESVDRNPPIWTLTTPKILSLSARRAWIEISRHRHFEFFRAVALRKESVDRNCEGVFLLRKITMSLSARRAWIEILMQCQAKKYSGVALRKESVDRNV